MNDLCNHSGDNENCIILGTFCKLDFMLIHTVRLATSDKKKLRVRTREHKPVLLFIQSTYRRNACCLLDSTLQSPAAFWQYWINVVFLRLLNIQQGELNFINKKNHKNQTWILPLVAGCRQLLAVRIWLWLDVIGSYQKLCKSFCGVFAG